jgi:hypothetical protein
MLDLTSIGVNVPTSDVRVLELALSELLPEKVESTTDTEVATWVALMAIPVSSSAAVRVLPEKVELDMSAENSVSNPAPE